MIRANYTVCAAVLVAACLGACASGPTLPPTHYRHQLHEVIRQEVATRAQRDAHSRVLAESLEGGALEGLSQPELRAALGKAVNCSGKALCEDNGFASSDWYYEIGHMTDEDAVKQMPVLIVGFGPRGEVTRTWTLTTH